MTTVQFAYVASLPMLTQAEAIIAMTPTERKAFARYLDNSAYLYADEVPADYQAPTADSVLACAQLVLTASQEAATDLPLGAPDAASLAEYAAWLDSLTPDEQEAYERDLDNQLEAWLEQDAGILH